MSSSFLNTIKKYLKIRTNRRKNSTIHQENKQFSRVINNVQQRKFRKRKGQVRLHFRSINVVQNFKKNRGIYYGGGLIGSLVLFFVIIFSPIFYIENINIIKKDEFTNIEIAYTSIDEIRGKRILFTKNKNIKQSLLNYQENLKTIEINRIFPNTLKVFLESYKGVFNTQIKEKSYIITENGAIIPSKPKKELKNIDIIGNFNTSILLDYKKLIPEENIQKIYTYISGLENNIIDIKIQKLSYFQTERELHIQLDSGPLLLFSLEEPVDSSIKKTAIFNKEQLKIQNEDINYIDLRIKNKVFYCLVEDNKTCNQNIKKIYY